MRGQTGWVRRIPRLGVDVCKGDENQNGGADERHIMVVKGGESISFCPGCVYAVLEDMSP